MEEEVKDGRCLVCICSLRESDLTQAAFDPGDPPVIIAPGRRQSRKTTNQAPAAEIPAAEDPAGEIPAHQAEKALPGRT